MGCRRRCRSGRSSRNCCRRRSSRPVHRRRRQGRDIRELSAETCPGQPPAVDQDQGGVRAQSPQIDAGRHDPVRPAPVGPGQKGARGPAAGVVLRQIGQDIGDGSPTAGVEFVAIQHDHGRGQFSRSLQQGPGDDHLVQDGGLIYCADDAGFPTPQEDDPRTRLRPVQPGSRQHPVESSRRRISAAQPLGSQPCHRIAGEEDLLIGLGCEEIEAVPQGSWRNVELARLLGAGGRAGRHKAGGQQASG